MVNPMCVSKFPNVGKVDDGGGPAEDKNFWITNFNLVFFFFLVKNIFWSLHIQPIPVLVPKFFFTAFSPYPEKHFRFGPCHYSFNRNILRGKRFNSKCWRVYKNNIKKIYLHF